MNQIEIGPPAHYNSVPRTVDKTVSWTITSNDHIAETGKEAPGWVSVTSDSGPITVAVRELGTSIPKSSEWTETVRSRFIFGLGPGIKCSIFGGATSSTMPPTTI